MKSFAISISKEVVSMGRNLYKKICETEKLVRNAYDQVTRPFVCMDCTFHNPSSIPEPLTADYVCHHWQPEYWEKQGYQRHWGDAAVSNWPELEILRKQNSQGTVFIILAPRVLRRPVMLSCEGFAWGSY